MSKKSPEKKRARELKRKRENKAADQKFQDQQQALFSLLRLKRAGLASAALLADVLEGFLPKSSRLPANSKVEALLESTSMRHFINIVEKALYAATKEQCRSYSQGYSFLSTATASGEIWSGAAPVLYESGDLLDYHVLQAKLDCDPEAVLAVWVIEIMLPTGARIAQCLTRDGDKQTYALANGDWAALTSLDVPSFLVAQMGEPLEGWEASDALDQLLRDVPATRPINPYDTELEDAEAERLSEYEQAWGQYVDAVSRPLRLAQDVGHYEMVALAHLRDVEAENFKEAIDDVRAEARLQAQREAHKELSQMRRKNEDLERRLAWAVKRAGATPQKPSNGASSGQGVPAPAQPLQSRLRQIFG